MKLVHSIAVLAEVSAKGKEREDHAANSENYINKIKT